MSSLEPAASTPSPDDEGRDICQPTLSPTDGTVTVAAWDSTGWGYGNHVRIATADGASILLNCGSAHLAVSVGQHVKAGQVVARAGDVGRVAPPSPTAPHLHWRQP